MTIRTPARVGLLITAGLLALTACGSSSSENTTSVDSSPSGENSSAAPAGPTVTIEGVGDVTVDAAAAAMLPAKVASAGSLSVATNAPYQPFIDFVVEGKQDAFQGLDYDLLQAIGGKLGIKAPFTQQPFDGLVPGLQAGKYDAIVGGITDNKERQQVATFVDYSASGTGILVLAGNPQGVMTLNDLCGTKVAVQKAAKQVQLLKAFSKQDCAGKAIDVTEYPQNTDALNALLAGQSASFVATKVNLVDLASKTGGKVEVIDDPAAPNGYQASPNGIGVLKARADLATAIQAGLQSLMDDGTYTKIMAKWDQEPIAIDKATIDAAID